MTTLQLLGPTIAIVAFLFFARGVVARSEGRKFRVFPELGLILFDLCFRFIFGEGYWYEKVLAMLLDNGIGLVVSSMYLVVRKNHPKMLFVPGILLLMTFALLNWGGKFVEATYHKVQGFFVKEEKNTRNISLLLELGPDDKVKEVEPILNQYKAQATQAFPTVSLEEDENLAQYYLVDVDSLQAKDLMEALKKDVENVDQVDYNYTEKLIAEPTQTLATQPNQYVANDPELSKQWGFVDTKINETHTFLASIKPKKKAKVAIVDTGVDDKHEDLNGVFRKSAGKGDAHGHGTHCAGVAGANTNNGIGMASLNWEGKFVEITAFKALNDDGSGSVETVAQAIIDAAKDGADVISMSLGGWHVFPPRAEVDAINYALKKGCIVIVAAGNSDEDARFHSPANIKGVITVSATDKENKKASFSNTNTSLKMPIAAPGVAIHSLKTQGGYVAMSGTSMATPMVAGLVGCMRALNPNLTAKDAYEILNQTGQEGIDVAKIGKEIRPLEALQKTARAAQ